MPNELTGLYDSYVDTFRETDGKLPAMMQLKRVHTDFVVKNAELIADGEGFSSVEREVALAACLLHDTGRYEQLRRFDTFQDSKSIDHAVFSHDIVKAKGWLEQVRSDALRSNARTILNAVLYHNRRDLPSEVEANPASLLAVASHTVRDADKLDIFRVLEDQFRKTDWRADSRAFWNLQVEAAPNPVVVECIEDGRPVDYQHIKTLADFVLIQVGWMISGLHFATTRRLCAARGHLAFRRMFVHQLTDDPAVDRLCDLAERTLA